MEELHQVLGLKKARKDLLQSLIEASNKNYNAPKISDPEEAKTVRYEDEKRLRHSGVVFVAEFLFVIMKLKITSDAEALRKYLVDHNAGVTKKIAILKEAGQAATASGLTISRLSEGIISEEKIEEVVADAQAGFFRFDQSTLGALLNELMVKQSINTLLDTLGRCGFLTIVGRQPKFISSRGSLEEIYGTYLSDIKRVFQST